MTDPAPSAAGARLLALGASVAATLALMGGMAAAAPDSGAVATPPAATPPAATPPAATLPPVVIPPAAIPPAAIPPPAVPPAAVPPAPVRVPPKPAAAPRLKATKAPPTTSSHAS